MCAKEAGSGRQASDGNGDSRVGIESTRSRRAPPIRPRRRNCRGLAERSDTSKRSNEDRHRKEPLCSFVYSGIFLILETRVAKGSYLCHGDFNLWD